MFWDFTWDEMAKYDIPAQITKVLEVTGQADLQYVGHSMGTTAFMAMHHYRLDIAAKVRLAHFLAPVATVGHMKSPIAWIAGLQGVLGWILDLLGIGEFLPSNGLMDCLASLFCQEGGLQV
jgi:predicted alpha/beta hydrolase